MADVREQILARLVAVCKTVRGFAIVLRNQVEISDSQLPALVIFDADEEADARDPVSRPANAPRRVTMRPEIRILSAGPPEEVGTTINLYRTRLVKAVLTDATLLGLTAENVSIRYDGAATQLKVGRSMQGDMLCAFSISYYLKPSDL